MQTQQTKTKLPLEKHSDKGLFDCFFSKLFIDNSDKLVQFIYWMFRI